MYSQKKRNMTIFSKKINTTLQNWWIQNLGAVLEKKGSTKNKKEGDKKTPKGIFENWASLFLEKDRKKKTIYFTKMYWKLKKEMGWCNDISFFQKKI